MNWRRTTLGDVADIVSGSTPKSTVAAHWDGDVAWATPTDLSQLDGKYISKTDRTISPLGLDSSSARLLPPNSVLFSSRAPIGLVAINTIPMATNQGFKSFVPRAGLNADYLYWWLKEHRKQLQDMGNGATFKEVSKAVVARVPLLLPPLDEQIRVAHLLDQADSIRRRREQALSLADDVVHSAFLELCGHRCWPTRPLADVVARGTIVTYGIVQAGPEVDGGVPYIRTGDIKNGKINLEGLRHTSPEIASKFGRSRVRAGEIVMSIRATVGTTALVPPELEGANLTQGTARIAPGDDVDAEYLISFLRSRVAQDWLQGHVKGATFREITLARLRELPVPVAPRSVQNRFSKIYNEISELSLKLAQDRSSASTLFAALSQSAFRGGF